MSRTQDLDVRASRVLQPLLERLAFTVDEDRPDNRIGDQVVPNAVMHRDLRDVGGFPSR